MKMFKLSIIVLSGAEGLCLGQEDSKQTYRITTGMMRCLHESLPFRPYSNLLVAFYKL
jgi:hypothetical protein